MENNTAEEGGGIQIRLFGFSTKNRIFAGSALVVGNKAHNGGGMYISFTNFSEQNAVELDLIYIMNNTLSSSTDFCMGGGIALAFAAGTVTLPSNNAVVINRTLFGAPKVPLYCFQI